MASTCNPARKLFPAAFLCFLYAGCSGPSGRQGEPAPPADSSAFITFPAPGSFLPGWSMASDVVSHFPAEPNSLHPCNGASVQRTEVNTYIHRFLLRLNYEKSILEVDAAKGMPVMAGDRMSCIFSLQENLTWDDGSPFTAEDVVFTFKASACPYTANAHRKQALENLADVKALGPDTVIFTFRKAAYDNISFLVDFPLIQRKFYDPRNVLGAYTFSQVLNADSVQQPLAAWAEEFNSGKYEHDPAFIKGLGPYRLAAWEEGQRIVLEKKAGVDEGIAFPEKIIFRINRDPVSQELDLRSSRYDVSTYLSSRSLLELQKDEGFRKNYHSVFVDTYNFYYLAMNMKPDGISRPRFFVDRDVRRAVALLTPVEDIINVVNYGKGRRVAGPVSPLNRECNRDLSLIPYDSKQALQLLEKAGWKDTDKNNVLDKVIDGKKQDFVITLNYLVSQPEWRDIAGIIAESLRRTGIGVNLNAVEYAVFIDKAQNHDFDMMLGVWTGSVLPEDYSQLWHTRSWSGKGSNFTGFGNAETDALIDSIKYAGNEPRRLALAKELQKAIYDEQPYVFLYSGVKRCAVHKRFAGIKIFHERPYILLNRLELAASAR